MRGLTSPLRTLLSTVGRDMPATFWYLWAGTVVNRLGGFVFGHFGSGALWAGAFVLGLILSASYLALSIPGRRRQAQQVGTGP